MISVQKRETIYRDVVVKSKLAVWNGPMGVFEMDAFAEGSKAVAEALKDATETYTIVGGGDSAAAIEKFGFTAQLIIFQPVVVHH